MANENDDAKLVAEIEIGTPIAFNTSMNDIISTDDDDNTPAVIEEPVVVVDGNPPPVDPPATTDPPPADPLVDPPQYPAKADDVVAKEKDDDQYKDYTEASLVGQSLKTKHPHLFGEEMKTDMQWEEFIEKIDGYIDTSLDAGQKYIVNNLGELKEYVEFLLEGGNPDVLKTALSDAEFSKINLEEASDDQKEEMVRAMYKDMDLPGDEIDNLVEAAKLANKLNDKAELAKGRFDAKEKDILKAASTRKKAEDENHRKYLQNVTKSITDTINTGDLLGMTISVEEQSNLKDAFFNPTEIMEVPDGKGGTVARKFTKYQVLEAEFKKSIPMQVAFGKLLLDGFKFDNIKDAGRKERDKDILDVLRSKSTDVDAKEQKGVGVNAYLTPVMEYDVK